MNCSRFAMVASLALSYQCVSNAANEVTVDLKADCVGRMQISVPGQAEVAAQTPESWKLPGSGSRDAKMRFIDGVTASWSTSFPFKISHPLDPNEAAGLTKHSEWTRAVFDERARANFLFDKKSFRSVRTTPWFGVTWSYRRSPGQDPQYVQLFLVNVDRHLIEWGSSVLDAETLGLQERVTSLISDLSPRPTHTLPAGPGLCYPYLFVKDDGQAKREVATTYRLKEHPDITVMLQDKSAMPHLKNERSQHHVAKFRSDSFWTNQYPTSSESVLSLWNDPYQRTKLAGYDGVESYVEIKRADGVIDYGYYVSVRGSAEAKEDEPDMTLYVIRESSVAKAKGVLPYGDEKTFLALAKSIAASVKRRPTK